ncbi:MAG: putative bifunctional diguanylate cyclase/phosphodiesterase [Solirubrobacterales bacterium]
MGGNRGPEGAHPPTRGSWATQQLAEFARVISARDDESVAVSRGIEHVAEVLDAEVAALLRAGDPVATVGFGPAGPRAGELTAVADGNAKSLSVEGVGVCHASSVAIEEEPLQLVVARAREPFDPIETELLRSMARVLWLGLRSVGLLGGEHSARIQSERHAEENEQLLGALRQRQALLESLSRLQHAIVDRQPSQEILASVVEGLQEIVGAEVVGIRLVDRDDHDHTVLVASIGADEDVLGVRRRAKASEGLGGRAMRERGLVVADALGGAEDDRLAPDFAASGVISAIAAPLRERGEIVGSIAVGSRDSRREFDAREQQVVLAFAEHASLALGHARSVADALRESFRDLLTGLPNRALFMDRLDVALARADRTSAPVSVLFCDLDGFKTVNDSLGMQAGDRLLILVAKRLRGCLRPSDTLARLGGDEFSVLLEELREPEDAARAAQRILDALAAPFKVAGREISVRASIGIATGTDDPDTLLRDADLAMYRAKSQGKGRYAAFEPQMHKAVVERLELELDLNHAVDRGELFLVYQPIFNLRTGGFAGLEALLRWRHPVRGLVPPSRFVPLAEESGQILALGRWVLRTACQQAALWRARYPAVEGLQVGVNISAAQLREGGLIREVQEALAAAQLDSDGLTLEITESSLMEDTEACARRLGQLKELGIELALDDFGTGYSSLTYLRRFPLDNLKIDRSFIAEIAGPGTEPALLRAIIDLTEAFDLTAVAEGIERPDQLKRLVELGCELGQGNGLSPPLPASEADAFLLNVGLLGSPLEAAVADQRDKAPGTGSPLP